MAKSKKDSVVDEIKNNEVIKTLESIGNTFDKFVNSDEYHEFIEEISKLDSIVNKDNEKIQKDGKSDFTYQEKALMSAQLCAMGSVDSSIGTLMNIIGLRYREEINTLSYKAAAKNAEKKE